MQKIRGGGARPAATTSGMPLEQYETGWSAETPESPNAMMLTGVSLCTHGAAEKERSGVIRTPALQPR